VVREAAPPREVTPVRRAAPVGAEARRPRVSPAARREAERLGLDLASITGTGPMSSITLADIDRAAAETAAAVPTVTKDKTREMRRAIAASMSRSKREIPHYYLTEQIPLQAAGAWLERENAGRSITERVLMAAVQLKAVAVAATRFPDLNGFWQDGEFRPQSSVHIGVAISLRQGGLVAPAIHDTAEKPLVQLMKELTDLVARVRAGSMRSSEMSDPTLTVTNLGDRSVDAVYGVIYPPQVALVGFGKPAERPWVVDGEVRALPVVTGTLAADHRASDGHRGALFLAAINNIMQHPEEL
ncbi:MAG: dihydrolipoamide acetyltransferase family protein, partial [Rhodococcus sp. (in: high G+C Gram-positive bacteria)]|uniref:dihydrolipoamide acetyltransferase family protein n=1 Tax=Rhodococcus sp. TaxID=1831 RepID=UPI003BB11584